MKRLIENQKIRIDTHQRGNQIVNNWDDPSLDIHIHKTTYAKINGKQVTVEIRVPINSDRPDTFEINGAENTVARNRLSGEIRQALNNDRQRRGFIDDLISILDNYTSALSTEDRAKAAVRRLASNFNLTDQVEDDIVTYIGSRILSFTSMYQDENHRSFYLTLNQEHIVIGEITPYSRTDIRLNRHLQ